MSDSKFSIVDLQGVSEPITKLIETVSNGIGAIYKPTGRVRDARAEAKAMVILAEAEIEANDVAKRALERVNYREIRRQENVDRIVLGAAEEMPNSVSDERVTEDWIVMFFENCQDISDPMMQQVWSKLLAREVTKPNTFTPRTIQAVKHLTKEDAEMYSCLCSYLLNDGDGHFHLPLLDTSCFDYFRSNGITVEVETHLKNIGLLSGNKIIQCKKFVEGKAPIASFNYFSEVFVKEATLDESVYLFFESFPLTDIGNQLVSISGASIDIGFMDVLKFNGFEKTT